MAQRRQKGIFGLPVKYKDVRETNNRGSFHVHGTHNGGWTPALLAEIAENETLRREHAMFMLGLDTQLCAELPLESDGASELRALWHLPHLLYWYTLLVYSYRTPSFSLLKILTDRLGQRRPSGAARARQLRSCAVRQLPTAAAGVSMRR